MGAQNDALILTRLALKRYLLAVVIDLLPGVCYELLSQLGHDVVALAQSLSCNLHTKVAHGFHTLIVSFRILIAVEG